MSRSHRSRDSRAVGTLLAAVLAVAAVAVGLPAHAQESGEPAFTPTLFVLGSTTNNELRSAGEPIGDSALYTELELPFTFSGPRWSGGFSLNPAWRKQRELSRLDQFDSSVDAWLRGALTPRTRVTMSLGVARSANLTALDGPDLITSRADRVRGRAMAALNHTLNPAGDVIDISAEIDTTEYLDGEFVSERAYGLQLAYGRALTPRTSFGIGGGVSRFEYEGGSAVHSFSPSAGFSARLGLRTELGLGGGVSFVRGDVDVPGEEGPRAVTGRTVAADASLRHSGEDWSVSLTAAREVASGVALGEPTLRTRVVASIGWGDPRWRLGVSAGVARNEVLLDESGSLLLLGDDGLVAGEARAVDTFSACVDTGFRFTRWMSLVGSGRFANQRTDGGVGSLQLDLYRFSVGIAVHPYAGPIKTRRGADVLRRYGRAGSIGSC